MRKTKIIGAIGPARAGEEILNGDNIILTGGQASKQSGSTNTISMEEVK